MDPIKEALRVKHQADSEKYNEKIRYGLFSQPAPLAVGETNAYLKVQSRKDPISGEVATEMRNFYTKKLRPGQTDNVLFSKPGYNAIGDPYNQRSSTAGARAARQPDSWKKSGLHDINFKPARKVETYKDVPSTSYKYKPEGVLNQDPKRNRDADGYVVTGPRNLYTARLKKGLIGRGTTFSGPVPHVEGNDWGALKELTVAERAYHLSKVQEKPFSSQAKRMTWGTFSTARELVGPPAPVPRQKKRERVPL